MANITQKSAGLILWLLTAAAFAAPGDTELISQLEGAPVLSTAPDASSTLGLDRSISADGRYLAFVSHATNLVSGDTNGTADIFVYDRITATTTRVSINRAGTQANSISFDPSISANGRYVAFWSFATNLVSGDTNETYDVFVHDRSTAITTRVSVDSAGTQAGGQSIAPSPSISADGRYVAFESDASNLVSGDTNAATDVFVHDRNSGTTTRVSVDSAGTQANGFSNVASISADGRYVAFESVATNLVSGDTNNRRDIFIHDRSTATTSRVSVNSAGIKANGDSFDPSISADGRYVAFYSWASNLVSGDTNGTRDIFVHDRNSGTTTRVSVDSSGTQANGFSDVASISADGRYVAFSSWASNLVSGDTNGIGDIFVHDRNSGVTTRVSVDSAGTQANGFSNVVSISANGRYVAFSSEASNLVSSDTNAATDIFVHDRAALTTERLDVPPYLQYSANGHSYGGSDRSISADGRYVAFESDATDLVSGDTNAESDIFVRDRNSGTTSRVSVASAGTQANSKCYDPSISTDGRYVVFASNATNLVSGDTNTTTDVFVHDRNSGTTARISVASAGTQGNSDSFDPSISTDGRYVAFVSEATNLVSGDTNSAWDVFVRDRNSGTTRRVSVDSAGTQANSDSFDPSISADGRYVVFASIATKLVSGDTNGWDDIFVHDRNSGTTTRVSVASAGTQAASYSRVPSISADGRYVAFYSGASNLVSGDTNGLDDIFVHDRNSGTTTRVSINSAGSQANSPSFSPSISADVRYVVFSSDATNLVSGDTNAATDVFVHDRATGTTTRASVVASDGAQANGGSYSPSISATGAFVAFESDASNLTPLSPDSFRRDVFVHELAVTAVFNTGYRNPTSNFALMGGDGNGYETNPARAHIADGLSAVDFNSGTGTGTSCYDNSKDRHRFRNYWFNIPAASTISGIQVRLEAKVDNSAGAPKICVQLSWDGGSSWTQARSTATLGSALATYNLGGNKNTWGRDWSVSDFSNSNFRVRVIDVANSTARDFRLDNIAVMVTYY